MDIKQWAKLSQSEQDILSAKFGVTRSGQNNDVREEDLIKIPDVKKETTKSTPKKVVKRSNRGGATAKPNKTASRKTSK